MSASSSWDTSELITALQAASLQQQTNNGGWYMDSGASTHMIGDQGKLPIYCPLSMRNSHRIIVGNGSFLPVHGTGTTPPNTPSAQFLLHNVLHTNLVKNLISVNQFSKDNSCSVEFDPHGFFC